MLLPFSVLRGRLWLSHQRTQSTKRVCLYTGPHLHPAVCVRKELNVTLRNSTVLLKP